eukprot:TRINITY_DN6329_c0_g1_i1.p1 TRINITY_DN6329_c0_g1~~TRINITY_DN6329_c0_g1_i1.p1  ORF type:complete len:151 (-),score=32.65 TRINITY_DN6329_c0_g1_i1:31-483(-)
MVVMTHRNFSEWSESSKFGWQMIRVVEATPPCRTFDGKLEFYWDTMVFNADCATLLFKWVDKAWNLTETFPSTGENGGISFDRDMNSLAISIPKSAPLSFVPVIFEQFGKKWVQIANFEDGRVIKLRNNMLLLNNWDSGVANLYRRIKSD